MSRDNEGREAIKLPEDLSREALEIIAGTAQRIFYADVSVSGKSVWDPDSPVNGGDLVEGLGTQLEAYGLKPVAYMPQDAAKPKAPKKPKRAGDLSRGELERVVALVQDTLYLEGEDDLSWDPDKGTPTEDDLGTLHDLMSTLGLQPPKRRTVSSSMSIDPSITPRA